MRAFLASALLLVLLGSAAAADGPVSAAASVDKRGITIGDPIELTLIVEAEPGYQITDSGVGRNVGEFEVQEARPPQLAKIQGGRTRYTFRYRVSAFRVGDLVITQIGVTYRSPTGETGVAPTVDIPILITSVIQPGEDPNEIRPLKPQLRLPGAAPQLPAIAVQVALALVVLVMLALILNDPRELELPDVGLMALEDAETGRVAYIDTAARDTRDSYARLARERRAQRLRVFSRMGIDRADLATDRPYVPALLALFNARSRRS